eukprot:768278-Hanusia_phi.AAC.1
MFPSIIIPVVKVWSDCDPKRPGSREREAADGRLRPKDSALHLVMDVSTENAFPQLLIFDGRPEHDELLLEFLPAQAQSIEELQQ